MRYVYTKLDPRQLRDMTMQDLMKLFTQLLMQSNGDVDKALKWMDQLGKRYGFFNDEVSLEDFKDYLRDQDFVRSDESSQRQLLTSKGEQRIREDAFEEIFSQLKGDSIAGEHRLSRAGTGGEQLPETRSWQFGDTVNDIDFSRSIQNAVRNSPPTGFECDEDDLEVYEREQATSCATVMLVDVSHSMTLYGEDRITPAKKVAMGLAEFIQRRYPKDALHVALFGDQAVEVPIQQLPYISNGPFHTNTKAGLELAMKILSSHRNMNKQIFMITDGKPSAIFEDGHLYKNPFGLDPKIVSQTINEAVHCRRKGVVITTFMITSDPYLQDFIDRLTKANKGRAYFADLDNLGSFILSDYVRNRRKKV